MLEIQEFKNLEQSLVWPTLSKERQQSEINNYKVKEILTKYFFENNNMIMKIMTEITKIYKEFFISDELGEKFAKTLDFVLNKIIARNLWEEFTYLKHFSFYPKTTL